jgi:hypothetical protein
MVHFSSFYDPLDRGTTLDKEQDKVNLDREGRITSVNRLHIYFCICYLKKKRKKKNERACFNDPLQT